jgi:SPP1 gp7 family putative phage head morphogenesis protein
MCVTGSTEKWNEIKSLFSKYGNPSDYMPQYGTIKDLLYKNKISDLAKIQQTITQGFIQGKSIAKMSTNIQDIMDNFKYQADRIAITEQARVSGDAELMMSKDAAAEGIDIQRQWHAIRDGKTRDAHISLDGQRVGIDEPFTLGTMTAMTKGGWPTIAMNVRCRCAVIDIVDGENPQTMRGRKDPFDPSKGNEMMTFKSYKEWAAEKGLKFDKNNMLVRDPNFD